MAFPSVSAMHLFTHSFFSECLPGPAWCWACCISFCSPRANVSISAVRGGRRAQCLQASALEVKKKQTWICISSHPPSSYSACTSPLCTCFHFHKVGIIIYFMRIRYKNTYNLNLESKTVPGKRIYLINEKHSSSSLPSPLLSPPQIQRLW